MWLLEEADWHTYYVGEVKNQKALTGKAIQAIKKPESLATFSQDIGRSKTKSLSIKIDNTLL